MYIMKNCTGAVLSMLNNPLALHSSVKIPKLKSGQVLVKVHVVVFAIAS